MSGYVDRALAGNERLVARARMPLVDWVRAWAALAVLGMLLVGLWIFIAEAVRLSTTELAVTNRRVILKTGLIGRRTVELQLNAIEAVMIDQGALGRVFGFGRVIVHGSGDDTLTSPRIADPLGFRRAIAEAGAANGLRESATG